MLAKMGRTTSILASTIGQASKLPKTIQRCRLVALVACLLTVGQLPAWGTTEKVLHIFGNGTDGAVPAGPLVRDEAGNLYGATRRGGAYGQGTIFRLSLSNGSWTEMVLYTFLGGTDGRIPWAGLTADAAGNLYGTTEYGGFYGNGCVFQLSPSNGTWTETVLHSFNFNDGYAPQAGVVFDSSGNLYGTTAGGGPSGLGTVYQLKQSNGTWAANVIHAFEGGADGSTPVANLIVDAAGKIYGTTYGGGVHGWGTVFELTPANGAYTENILYSFANAGGDGAAPKGGLVLDNSGNLYGTTYGGGAGGGGTVFKLTHANGKWTESILHNFPTGTSDGYGPQAGLAMDTTGSLYGTSVGGGTYGNGAVFRLSLSNGAWRETILYSFTGTGDGGTPQSDLLIDPSGKIYGTTAAGGSNRSGVAFELTNDEPVPTGRPIVFVHGFCSQSSDWATLQSHLYPRFQSWSGDLYPNPDTYDVLYDPGLDSVKFYRDGAFYDESAIPISARFFRMKFYEPSYDANTGVLDPANVAKISILNKAYELSKAIKRINSLVHSTDVILVGHSMGGLVSRAYLENLASKGQCYAYGDPVPRYDNGTCAPGAGDAAFANDVADLLTIDTPHAGSPIASFQNEIFIILEMTRCIGTPSVNGAELNLKTLGGAGLVEFMNYDGSSIAGAQPAKNPTRIQAVENYFNDVTDAWGPLDLGLLTGYSDDVVLLPSQSIKGNLAPKNTKLPVQDVPTSYLSTDPGIVATAACWKSSWPVLHFIDCLGAQPYTQGNIFSQLSSYVLDQPVDDAYATTVLAKPITSSSATLNGTVNPKGSAGSAYFVWGTDPSLVDSVKTPPQPVIVNSKPQSFSADMTGLTSGATIYFQIVFSNSAGNSVQNGAILFLSTLMPAVTTTPASQITTSGATLNGKVNPKGSPGFAYFEWGTDPTLGSHAQTPSQPVTANFSVQLFAEALGGLRSATKYYFRIVYSDTSNGDQQVGTIRSFKTQR